MYCKISKTEIVDEDEKEPLSLLVFSYQHVTISLVHYSLFSLVLLKFEEANITVIPTWNGEFELFVTNSRTVVTTSHAMIDILSTWMEGVAVHSFFAEYADFQRLPMANGNVENEKFCDLSLPIPVISST